MSPRSNLFSVRRTVELIPISESGLLVGLSCSCITTTTPPRDRSQGRTRYWLYSHRNRPLALEHALKAWAARANSRQRKWAIPADKTSSSSNSSASSSGGTRESTALARGASGWEGGNEVAEGREAPPEGATAGAGAGAVRAGVEDTDTKERRSWRGRRLVGERAARSSAALRVCR
jgi:hypothetical protein